MITIDNCTLFAIDCKQPELAIKALQKTCTNLSFKEILFFSDSKPFNFDDNFTFIQIDRINSLDDYSDFMLYKLSEYINTEFCFSVHHDGFVINPHLWKEDFLKYDYIGAPWRRQAHFITDQNRVGNGGVSIRSKRLIDYIKTIPGMRGHEDTVICSQLYRHLISKGFTFAPLDIASQFSLEQNCDDLPLTLKDTFAFHGKCTDEHVAEHKKIIQNYYKDDLIKMSKPDLIGWLRNKAGSQDPGYFICNTSGNLQLQQIPEEYSELLDILRSSDIKKYLELGVGNGGSFFVDSLFLQKTATHLHCVDNIAYRDMHIQQSETKIQTKVDMLCTMFPEKEIKFFNQSTDDFFNKNTEQYDCIFIDADHSYEGVKKDYENSLKYLNEKGIIIFHDIANEHTGVRQLWEEIKGNYINVKEFAYKLNPTLGYACGIGVIFK